MKFASALYGFLAGHRQASPGRNPGGRLQAPTTPAAELDMVLIWSAIALLLFGLVMV